MPTNDANTSGTTGETPRPPSVFDFLYNDSRRIASFLSQFEGGHLTQVTRSDETGKTTGEESGRTFSLGVTRVFGGDSRSAEKEGTSAKEGLVRTFDPYWSNARGFLDYLAERDMIERDIFGASMGQFVLVRGKLAILDLTSMQSVWERDTFKRMLADGMAAQEGAGQNRQQRRAEGKAKPRDPYEGMPSEFRLAMELLPNFPHSTIASILTDFWSTWSTLSLEHLVSSPSDLILKHGSKIAGEWAMLGILDAVPEDKGDDLDDLDKLVLGLQESNVVAQATLGLTPVVRMLAGRPPRSFGLTPLLIFREVTGRATVA